MKHQVKIARLIDADSYENRVFDTSAKDRRVKDIRIGYDGNVLIISFNPNKDGFVKKDRLVPMSNVLYIDADEVFEEPKRARKKV